MVHLSVNLYLYPNLNRLENHVISSFLHTVKRKMLFDLGRDLKTFITRNYPFKVLGTFPGQLTRAFSLRKKISHCDHVYAPWKKLASTLLVCHFRNRRKLSAANILIVYTLVFSTVILSYSTFREKFVN